MPAFFSEQHGRTAYERMLADPATPRTTIEVPGRRRPVLLATAAFGVLTALTYDDPLAAVAGVVHLAATAHGPDAHRFLAGLP
jgi:hydrogenase/urease accessory protein HupE